MKHLKAICLVLIVMLSSSCVDRIMYRSYHHFPKERWGKGDTVALNIHIVDSVYSHTKITFLVRNLSSYSYQDFSATVLHNLPDSTSWKSSRVSFILANKDGQWRGSGWAGLYQSSVSLGEIDAPPGNYTFKIAHQMQDEQLTGINDIGILVERVRLDTKTVH